MSKLTVSELNVLVVGPSADQRKIISRTLYEAGVVGICTVDSGQAAAASINHTAADLVVSAHYLPDMTGADLVLLLRHNESTADSAFLLISSETRFAALESVRQAGAVLTKPFSARDLDLALNSTLAILNPEAVNFDHYDTESLEILIVYDNRFARRQAWKVLSAIGMKRFTKAVSGAVAMKFIGRLHFALVATHFDMQIMDGRELIEQTGYRSAQSSIPILMVTSEASENRLAAVHQAGATAMCDKPFEFETVRELIC